MAVSHRDADPPARRCEDASARPTAAVDVRALLVRVGQLEALHRIALAMSSSLDLDEVLAALARELVSTIPRVSQCTVSLVTADRQALCDAVRYSETDGFLAISDEFFPLSVYRTTAALLEAKKGHVACSLDDPTLVPGTRRYLETCGWRCCLELPLVVEGESVGLVEVGDETNGVPWSRGDIAFIEIVASQAASAIRNAQLHASLRRQAERDSLTGLLNHANFYRHLHEAVGEEARTVAVLLLDIDDFKQTNDQLGHLAGDEILKRTAILIGDWLGADGIAGRIGGDEFAVILLRSDDLDARASQLLQTLEQHGIRASLGAAAQGRRAAIDLARAADGALLEAKRSGKTTLRLAA
jgi:diguanylate cyclase (GGDEF)-like protein